MLIRNIIIELERESGMRKFVFPRLKHQGKLTEIEGRERIERLDAALKLLYILDEAGVWDSNHLLMRLTPRPKLNTEGVL